MAILACPQAALAQAAGNCTAIVKSVQDAVDKADWVIEGDVVDLFRLNAKPPRNDLSIANVKVLHALEPMPRFSTTLLSADPCFPDGGLLQGKAAGQLIGKRMRFFGTKLTSGRGRSFFFMQAAEQAMPGFAASRRNYRDTRHAAVAAPDGWSRARSTDGGFSVEMPGSFSDITKGSGGQPAFMLRGTDRNGSTYMAVFERSGPGAEMGGTFDHAILEDHADITRFKGADAVLTSGTLAGSNGTKLTHGLWFRVPGGTYMLSVVTDKEHEAASLASRQRFFNSLVFQ